jgi:hypothetical protein
MIEVDTLKLLVINARYGTELCFIIKGSLRENTKDAFLKARREVPNTFSKVSVL